MGQIYSTGEFRGRAAYEGTSSTVQAKRFNPVWAIRDSVRHGPRPVSKIRLTGCYCRGLPRFPARTVPQLQLVSHLRRLTSTLSNQIQRRLHLVP